MIVNCLKSIVKYGKQLKGLLGNEFDSEPVYGDTDSYECMIIK